MKLTTMIALLTGAIAGLASAFCFPILGAHDPNSDFFGHYSAVLALAGFASALACPKSFWLCPIGIFMGQALFALPAAWNDPSCLPLQLIAPLWLLVLFFVAFFCLFCALPGATAGWLMMTVCGAICEFRRTTRIDRRHRTNAPIGVELHRPHQ
jgi:hypothetical protein